MHSPYGFMQLVSRLKFPRSVLSQIALETRDYLYNIIWTNFVSNKWSARALS